MIVQFGLLNYNSAVRAVGHFGFVAQALSL